jgi:drug/metabolite transporter (DMT)-like permease
LTIRSATNFRMTSIEWALLLALSLLWGGGFYFGQIALTELPPFTIVFCRVTIAAIALISVAAAIGRVIIFPPGTWPVFLGLGTLNCLMPFALLLWAQARIGSGLASVLAATTPLLTVLAAHFLSVDEKLTKTRIAGVLLGLTGVAVAMGPVASEVGDHLLPCIAVLGAALGYAFAGVFGRSLNGISALPLAAGQLVTTSLLSLPIALVIEKPWSLAMPSMPSWGAVFALALLSTALGYVLFFHLLSRVGAVNVSLVSLLVPITALLLAALVLGERLRWSEIVGTALILVGLAIVDGRFSRSVLA